MDSFNVMLHEISRDLHPDDLESLVNICGIEESRKPEAVKSGHNLFKQLRHEDRISEEKLEYLKSILNAVKRRDLVRRVEEFEGVETTNETERDGRDTRKSSTDSTSHSQQNRQADNRPGRLNNADDSNEIAQRRGSHRSVGSEGTNQIPCCTINWPCFKMDCYKIHFCYVLLMAIFSVGVIIVSLFWYGGVSNVSEHLNAEKSSKNAGAYVIIGLIVIFLLSLFIVFYVRKYWRTRHATSVVFSNREICGPVTRGFIPVQDNRDPVPLVALQSNPNCEVEMNNIEPTTSERYARKHTAGDTEPILSP